jgi:hypothetical protein
MLIADHGRPSHGSILIAIISSMEEMPLIISVRQNQGDILVRIISALEKIPIPNSIGLSHGIIFITNVI